MVMPGFAVMILFAYRFYKSLIAKQTEVFVVNLENLNAMEQQVCHSLNEQIIFHVDFRLERLYQQGETHHKILSVRISMRW